MTHVHAQKPRFLYLNANLTTPEVLVLHSPKDYIKYSYVCEEIY